MLIRTFFDPFESQLGANGISVGMIVSASQYQVKDENFKSVKGEKRSVYYVMTSLGPYEMFDFDMEEVYDAHDKRNNRGC